MAQNNFMTEEKPIKKHGFFEIIFKILTLGGLLAVIYQALKKSGEKKN